MSLIKISNLSYKYGSSKEYTLNNISLDFNSGQIIGILGPNGAGKTTLIKILLGLIRDIEGSIYIDGNPISNKTKSLISYMPDNIYLNERHTIKNIIAYFKEVYSDFNETTMYELMEKMHINPNDHIKHLSKGNKEKLQLALCLSRKAKIYILDEPIGGVDPANREFLLNTIFKNYTKDSLMIISTHLISDIEEILDRAIFLKKGKVIIDEQVKVLKNVHQKSLNDLFKEIFICKN